MVDTVEYGSGQSQAQSQWSRRQTASAQTGIYEDGVEIVHAWFAGFIRQEPRYTIVVLAEGMESGGDYAAPCSRRSPTASPITRGWISPAAGLEEGES